MNTNELQIPKAHIHKLLCAKNPDVSLLYLYVTAGNDPEKAEQELQLSASRLSCATATLRQLGLWTEEKPVRIPGEPPRYSEVDVLDNENTKWQGVLLSADEQQFVIEITYKAKPEGAKRKIDVTENITFTYDKIKYTKYTIRFK